MPTRFERSLLSFQAAVARAVRQALRSRLVKDSPLHVPRLGRTGMGSSRGEPMGKVIESVRCVRGRGPGAIAGPPRATKLIPLRTTTKIRLGATKVISPLEENREHTEHERDEE